MQISVDRYADWFLERYDVEPLRCSKMERIQASSSSRYLLPFFNRSRSRRHATWIALRFSLWYFPHLFNIDFELPRSIEIFKTTRIWGALTSSPGVIWRTDNRDKRCAILINPDEPIISKCVRNIYYVIILRFDPVPFRLIYSYQCRLILISV